MTTSRADAAASETSTAQHHRGDHGAGDDGGDLHRAVADQDHESVGERNPERHADHHLDRIAATLPERRADADERDYRGEDRAWVAEDLLSQHPRQRRGQGGLREPERVRSQALGDGEQSRALGDLLEQHAPALAHPRRTTLAQGAGHAHQLTSHPADSSLTRSSSERLRPL